MAIDYQTLLDRFFKDLEAFPYLHSSDIPDIGLYMDQVTTFMEKHLQATRRSPEDKILTKTMINNYAKNHLLPAPVKKKYSKEHMLLLVFIYYFKGFLSLQDIQSLAEPLTDRFFSQSGSPGLEQIYQEAFRINAQEADQLRDQVQSYLENSRSGFADPSLNISDEDREFLQYYSLILSLGMDIYIKKRLMEQLIDAFHPGE